MNNKPAHISEATFSVVLNVTTVTTVDDLENKLTGSLKFQKQFTISNYLLFLMVQLCLSDSDLRDKATFSAPWAVTAADDDWQPSLLTQELYWETENFL